jgi:hypothetical protein
MALGGGRLSPLSKPRATETLDARSRGLTLLALVVLARATKSS